MRRTLRTFALFASFLSIQLSLFGGGVGCSLAMVADAQDSMVAMDMATMDMATMDMAAGDGTAHEVSKPCDIPSTESNCIAMAVCVFAAMTSTGAQIPMVVALPASNDVLATLAPETLGVAPDDPPPRA